jgi:predicted PurR-regulated permease PerM
LKRAPDPPAGTAGGDDDPESPAGGGGAPSERDRERERDPAAPMLPEGYDPAVSSSSLSSMGMDASGPVYGPEPAEPGRGMRAIQWLKRLAKLWGFLLFCIVVVYLFRAVVLPFIFAVLVAYILAPLVDRLARVPVAGRTVPRGLAVILIYINIIALLGLFMGYFIPKLSGDFARLFREAPHLFEKINNEYVPRAGAWVDQHLGAGIAAPTAPDASAKLSLPKNPDVLIEPLANGTFRVDLSGMVLEVEQAPGGKLLIGSPKPEEADNLSEGRWERSIKQWIASQVKTTETEARRAIEYGQKFVAGVITGFARLVLVLMVAAFILLDLQRLRGFVRSLVPGMYHRDYDRIVGGIDRGLSGVIRGQLLICLINGVLTYIGLWIFKVKYSLLLALVAAVMSLVPIFGSILSSIPIVAIALVSSGTFDLKQGVYVLAWIILIHLIEANYLNPKIMGGAAKIHPVFVVFALIAGEQSYGLVGALFAVPVASIIQTIFVYFRRKQVRAPSATMPAVAP